MNRLRRFFRRRDHRHVIRIVDIAVGLAVHGYAIPWTATKYRCCLCGHDFVVIDEIGIRQLQQGNAVEDVMKWMEDANEWNSK